MNSAFEAVLNFPSTAVMNFLTHRNAYALYPRSAYEDKFAIYILNSAQNTALNFGRTFGSYRQAQNPPSKQLETIDERPAIPRITFYSPCAYDASRFNSAFAADKVHWVDDSHSICRPIPVNGAAQHTADLVGLNSWHGFYEENSFSLEYITIATSSSEKYCVSAVEKLTAEVLLNDTSSNDIGIWDLVSRVFASTDEEEESKFSGFTACVIKSFLRQLVVVYCSVNIISRQVLTEPFYNIKWIWIVVQVKGRPGQVVTAHWDYNAMVKALMQCMIIVHFECEDNTSHEGYYQY
ncbi:hypothetical protein GYMLUDRAFT_63254 [Collybiopsis luxurians FD-317 M1]|uniref:Uncharacterized protein n=1 Tax=Collybiopsis luxurians FD-317 M1 TaxID=944289 RepID=A0A0D0AUU3_9AGAR|nr:hypothetical protein GYMLUDRAFT_63254 [Collybiopsis luxurians FD-317 M1]